MTIIRCVLIGLVLLTATSVFAWKSGTKCIPKHLPGKGQCTDGHCNFTNPDNVFYIGCENDCRDAHNSFSGYCGEDGFCHCDSQMMKTVNNEGRMCQNISMAEEYQNICWEDCQCNHNSVGGGCNFYFKACECGELNKGDYVCPYKTANEYFRNLGARYKRLGYDIFMQNENTF